MKLDDLTPVQKTAVFTLVGRAKESQKKNTILSDPFAVKAVSQMNNALSEFKGGSVSHSIRGNIFDSWVSEILKIEKEVTIINLGVGLETQFERIDNGRLFWYGIDFPEIIDLRNRLIPDRTGRRFEISSSVLDFSWRNEVQIRGRCIIICSGLLMYFEKPQVNDLLNMLIEKFPGADFIFDAISDFVSEVSNTNYQKSLQHPNAFTHYVLPPMPWGIRNAKAFMDSWRGKFTVVQTSDLFSINRFIFGRKEGFQSLYPPFRRKYGGKFLHLKIMQEK